MSNITNYAIIGAGSMGREHIRNIEIIKNAEVVALCDNNQESLNKSLNIVGRKIPTFQNHIDLINKPGIYKELCEKQLIKKL